MSTYLLAFVIGEFEYVETFTNNGTLVRVYTLPGRSEQGRFALDVGKRSLELYDDYFDTPYPLPKMDMIAIPDFAAGAMENWGLVTYRENLLLIDETNSSATTKQNVAEVVAHELAHQWFGNLVTMEWWTNLWLNEGFATWMANFVLNKLFPEWDIWTQFLSYEYADALSLDGLRSTHPIEVPVNHPDEVAQIFDAISYSKGASVIRMIHDFIGADAFRSGLQIYLKRHAYGNAVTEDLWKALAEASGQPVQKMMDTWTKQAGYPLIQVMQQDKNTCVLSQKRFLAGGEQFTEEESVQTWHIPIALEFHQEGKSNYSKHIFSDTNIEIPMQVVDFVKLNSFQIALARVNYLPEQWQALAEAIGKGKLAPADRYGILSDALSLARSGHLSTGQLIRLLSAYKNEDNYVVWMMVLGALGALENILEETPESTQLASFAQSALRSIVDKLGWQEIVGEPHTTKLLRESVLHAMGNYGDFGTINEAVTRFNNHVSGAQLADPNLRKSVYGITAKHSENKMFNVVIEMYRKEVFQEEKARLLATLGKFTDSVSVSTALAFAFNSGEVRFGDVSYTLSSLGSHAAGRRAAWNFLMNNWETISQRYSGGGLKMLGRIISLICDSFSREEDAQAVENFFKDHPAPSATRAIAEAIERIRIKAAWYERDKDEIADALK
jgi:puromycin-sensitive aminopeptidase